MASQLLVAASPHVHGNLTTSRLMRDVLIALLPAWLVGVWVFGLPALIVSLVSVGACVGLEYLLQRFVLKTAVTINDWSAAVTGLLLAMNLPSGLPLWMVLVGALMAIGVAKASFGGLGNNLFNPALFARAFLLISFPAQMATWPLPLQAGRFGGFDAETGATMLSHLKHAAVSKGAVPLSGMTGDLPAFSEQALGFIGGSLGEVSAFALLLGGIYLLVRRVISWHIPVAVLGSAAILSGIMWLVDSNTYPMPLYHLLSGGMLLGALFMATDYSTSPMTPKGMIVFGVGIGLLTISIRLWGAYPEGMSFAILVMNALVPLIDKYMKPSRFGSRIAPQTEGGKKV